MEEVLTIKVRLKPDNLQAQQFSNVSETYRQACNIVSQWYFDNHFKVIRKYIGNHIVFGLVNMIIKRIKFI